MFTRLKQYLVRKANEGRMKRHFASAEGSEHERVLIAAAMSAVEDSDVKEQRLKLPSDEQINFMMAYECFVLWAFKRGMETALKPEAIESAIDAIQRHFTKHAWYRPGAFEKIWKTLQDFMTVPPSKRTMGTFIDAAKDPEFKRFLQRYADHISPELNMLYDGKGLCWPLPDPVGDMGIAARAAGYPYEELKVMDPRFGLHVALYMAELCRTVREISAEWRG